MDLFDGEKYESFTKIDYKPATKCDGSKNDGQYYAGYVTKAEKAGELCKFHIKYTCEKDGKYSLIEVDETQRDTFDRCGAKMDSRKNMNPATAENPTRKSNCEIKIAEPKKIDQKFLKSL